MGYTKTVSVNGSSAAQNVLTLLLANGYTGPALVPVEGTLYNADASTDAYLFNDGDSVNVPGTKQVETLTCPGTVTVAGNGQVVVTSATMTGSPKTVNFAVTVGMVAKDIRQAAINALDTDAVVNAFLSLTHDYKTKIIATVKTVAANDGTLDLTIGDGTSTGVTTASSANTTAGAIATTTGLPFGPTSPSKSFTLVKGTDLSGLWIYTSGAVNIVFEIS